VLTTGDVLNGRYRLEGPLASGGMGDVWRASDAVLGRDVAVKLLRTTAASDPGFATRFRDEARTMAALRHPGVAPVYDFDAGGDGRPAYLVTALVDGEPLDRRIAVAGRLDPAETMSVVAQAARALHAVHEAGVVHRDVKPGNLIVQADGTVILIDFGIARSPQSAAVTAPDEAVGTARYMAPEQVSKQPITPAADIYALGVVAYHCLAGRPPFLGGDPAAVAMSHLREDPPPLPSDVPAAVQSVVTTAMAKRPADRFPSAAAMAAAAKLAGPGVAGTAAAAGSGATGRPASAGPAPAPAAPVAGRAESAGSPPAPAAPVAGRAESAGPAPAPAAPVAGRRASAGPAPAPAGAGGGVAGRASAAGGSPAEAARVRRHRRAVAWAAVLVALTAIGIVLAIADPIGILPGPGSPPATPAPITPGSGGGAGGDGSPGSGAPGTSGGGNPGGGTGPTGGQSGTAPGPTTTGNPTEGSTADPGSTGTEQPNAPAEPSQPG